MAWRFNKRHKRQDFANSKDLKTDQAELRQRLNKDPVDAGNLADELTRITNSIDVLANEILDIEDQQAVARQERQRRKELAELDTYFSKFDIELSKQGFRQFFRQILGDNPDPAVAAQLVEQLSSGTFEQRQAAQQALMKLPAIPIALLAEASNSSEREIAYRASEILKRAIPQRRQTIQKVLRAIELLEIQGLAAEIFAVIQLDEKYASNLPVEQLLSLDLNTARAALIETTTADDLELIDSLISDPPAVCVRWQYIRWQPHPFQ